MGSDFDVRVLARRHPTTVVDKIEDVDCRNTFMAVDNCFHPHS